MQPMISGSSPARSAGVPAKSYRRIPWLAAAALIFLGIATELWSPAEGKPDPSQLAAMADALKYLQELDKYYSQVARPSPRSDSLRTHELTRVEKALRMLQLQELDRFYSQRTRPRFGKRTELRPVPDDSNSMESAERLWGRLTKRR
ncbi:neuropeptide F [Hetaerina americana]|uniref:neuropeptide F n=1 Tax=Hetaerina americana TaxID=62018 RepID=UPI003A7F419E